MNTAPEYFDLGGNDVPDRALTPPEPNVSLAAIDAKRAQFEREEWGDIGEHYSFRQLAKGDGPDFLDLSTAWGLFVQGEEGAARLAVQKIVERKVERRLAAWVNNGEGEQ